MGAQPAVHAVASPLSLLETKDRMLLIRALTRGLAEADATAIIAALGSPPIETASLPDRLQDHAAGIIVRAFPAGHGAVIVSQLGIARVGTDAWLSGVRGHFEGKGVDAASDEIRREVGLPAEGAQGS